MDLAPQQESSSTDLVSEHTEFQSHMPYMGISRGSLTMQQEKLVSLISSGMTIAAAGRGAGYSSPQATYAAAKVPDVQQAIEYFRQEMREEVKSPISTRT